MSNELISQPQASLGEILIAANVLTKEQVESVIDFQKNNSDRFGEAAVRLGYLTERDLAWALARQFSYPMLADDARPELRLGVEPFSPFSERIRDLRAAIIKGAGSGSRVQPFMLTGDVQGVGTTFIAANLAVAFGQIEGKTLLLECNFRRPRIASLFGVANSHGLTSVLSRRSEPEVVRPFAEFPSLYVLPAGSVPPNPTELLQGSGLTKLLSQLSDRFDYIVIDAPPWSDYSDAQIILETVGVGALIVNRGLSKQGVVAEVSNHMARISRRFLGVVMNDC